MMLPEWVILHVPHDSLFIPDNDRNQLILNDPELRAELLAMTDHWTMDLFAAGVPLAQVVRAEYSRLFVDVERFEEDAVEPMASIGMGVIYERTSDGRQLRRPLTPTERQELMSRYKLHHAHLIEAVQRSLDTHGMALILDAHSFPSKPLPCELDQRPDRPQICIGTDEFHTSPQLADAFHQAFRNAGFTVLVNAPFAGTMVPAPYYRNDRRVASVMVEVNRALYMNESTGQRSSSFNFLVESTRRGILSAISNC